MFFKKKPPPKPVAPRLPTPTANPYKTTPEDDALYNKILQAFVEIQKNSGKSLAKTASQLEQAKVVKPKS